VNDEVERLTFFEKLEHRVDTIGSHLCVGLDPHLRELFPSLYGTCRNDDDFDHKVYLETTEIERCEKAFTFCKNLIDATVPCVVAYKPNSGFFEALGPNHGLSTLRRVMDAIPSDVPVLLDCKRGDVGSTSTAYARACYGGARGGSIDNENTIKSSEEGLGADAVTLSPLMGWDSVRPFITGRYASKGAFLLCKTSNAGSNDLLGREVPYQSSSSGDNKGEGKEEIVALYQVIADLVGQWSHRAAFAEDSDDEEENDITAGNDDGGNRIKFPRPPRLGLVVGATDPSALSAARAASIRGTWILAPGVGAQGGNLRDACLAGFELDKDVNNDGTRRCSGLLVPVSRAVSGAEDPAGEARRIRDSIEEVRKDMLIFPTEAVLTQKSLTDAINTDAINTSSTESKLETYQRRFLQQALGEGVLKFGEFVLKSGRTSPYFFNAGLFASGEALDRLGSAYASAIMSSGVWSNDDGTVNFDVIFGPAYKGISLGALVCASLYREHGINVSFAYNRKEAKDHGEGGTLVGACMRGRRVLIVDDVITAGTAIRESCKMLTSGDKDNHAIPVGIVVALDRAEKRTEGSNDVQSDLSKNEESSDISAVQAIVRDMGLPVVSIVSLHQLWEYLKEGRPDGNESVSDDNVLERVSEYRKRYGV